MKAAKARILEVAAEFEKISGRRYGLFEEYRMEDAELALVLIGSTCRNCQSSCRQAAGGWSKGRAC